MVITNFFSSYFFPPFSSSSSSSSSSPQPNNIMSTTSSLNSQNGVGGGGGDLLNSLSFSSTSMISADEFSTSSTSTTPTPSTMLPFYDPQITTTSFSSTTPLDSTSAIESLKILLTGIFGNSPGASTIIDNLGTVLNCSGVRPEEVISKIEQLVLTSTKLLSSSSSSSNDTAAATAEALKTNSTEGSSSLTELYFAKGTVPETSSSSSFSSFYLSISRK